MVNYVKVTNRKTFQNKISPELNSTKHTPSLTVWFLRNCGIADLRKALVAELRKIWVSQKRNRAILLEMTFANDCANCCFFSRKTDAQIKKNFANGNPKLNTYHKISFLFFLDFPAFIIWISKVHNSGVIKTRI